MSGVPSFSRSSASSLDDVDNLIARTVDCLIRLQTSMTRWKDQEEAAHTRAWLARILQADTTSLFPQ
jgi:hypothetical protein